MLDGMAVFILNEKRALIYYIAQIKDWQYSYGVKEHCLTQIVLFILILIVLILKLY